ncbi:hypothetical protein XENORESO_002359, partial [Xenotaenia resolanae]
CRRWSTGLAGTRSFPAHSVAPPNQAYTHIGTLIRGKPVIQNVKSVCFCTLAVKLITVCEI